MSSSGRCSSGSPGTCGRMTSLAAVKCLPSCAEILIEAMMSSHRSWILGFNQRLEEDVVILERCCNRGYDLTGSRDSASFMGMTMSMLRIGVGLLKRLPIWPTVELGCLAK